MSRRFLLASAATEGKKGGQQEVEHGRKTQQRDVVEQPHQDETEQRAADNAADAVCDVNPAPTGRAVVLRQDRARQREHRAGDEAVGRQQHEAAQDGLGDADGCAADEDHVAQGAQHQHLHGRQQGNEELKEKERRVKVSQAGGPASEPGADAGEQEPVTENDAKHHLVAGKHAEHLAHQRELRHHGGDAEAEDGEKNRQVLGRRTAEHLAEAGHRTSGDRANVEP